MSKDAQKPPRTGEDYVFFPTQLTDPKPNYISITIFEKKVEESGMDESYCPRFPIPDESDPENPHTMSLLQTGEKTIFPLQINVRLRIICMKDYLAL